MTECPAVNRCRICGSLLFEAPLLSYANMPAAAQHLPDASGLAGDQGVDLEVCQCSGCGLVQLSNEPVPYYRDVIRAAAVSREMADFRRQQFAGFTSRFALRDKKILEVGCGRGEFLALMQEHGVDVCGLEHAADSVAACVAAGLQAIRGYPAAGGRLPGAPFDAFYSLNYFEHLPDLNEVLRGVWDNLQPDAVGLVEVPNFDMIARNRLFTEFIGDHLFYFTQETFTATLSRNGFEVLQCDVVWHDYILSSVVKKRAPFDLSTFAQRQEAVARELKAYTERFGPMQTAVWGAGHQALAILALAGLGGEIRYVVDSSPFKQGKYTPATHIPIVSPCTLNTDPVQAVIVMAASYSDEVVRILQKIYPACTNVAVLREYGLEHRTGVAE